MKLSIIILILLCSSLFGMGDFKVRSGTVSPGISYDLSLSYFNTGYPIHYEGFWQIREWRIGIYEKVEIIFSPWQFLTIGVKVNLVDKGGNSFFNNISVAPFIVHEGIEYIEVSGWQQDRRLYSGCAISTMYNAKNKSLELSISPNIAGVLFEYYSPSGSENSFDAEFIDLNIPLGFKYYWGRKIRGNIALGMTGIIPIYETNTKVSNRRGFSISLSSGVAFGSKRSRAQVN